MRCLLGYVVLPILTPMLGVAAGAGPAIGLPIGIIALVFDVRGIRRFWLANHRWRWPITALYSAVIVLVTTLVISDIAHLARLTAASGSRQRLSVTGLRRLWAPVSLSRCRAQTAEPRAERRRGVGPHDRDLSP